MRAINPPLTARVESVIISPVRFTRSTRILLSILFATLLLSRSSISPCEQIEGVRAFTRNTEFDYIRWTLGAISVKIGQFSLGLDSYLGSDPRHQIVLDYLDLVARINQSQNQITNIFADPGISDPQAASAETRQELDDLEGRQQRVAPVAESILQSQVSAVIADLGLTLGGQPVPPVLYHASALPTALIVSPRDVIRQDLNISLETGMAADKRAALEASIDQRLNVSSLVEDIGGIGVYPTMVMQTTDANFLVEVIAHEWIHNYLTLRPLGVNYETSPQLRVMNETTAAIAGKEIGRLVIERYYPEFLPPAPPPAPQPQTKPSVPEQQPAAPVETSPPVFDFRAEMRTTRITTDQLLKDGQIAEAEAYMEERRVYLWEHGYHIRKLNQAYFAFHGAYADQPGGAAGADPVGAAVRELRADSPTLAAFVNRISWMTSFNQLQRAVDQMASAAGR